MHTKSHKLSCNWKFAWKLLKICLILANRMETNTARAHTLNSHHLLCHRTFSVCVSSENYNNASECALCLLAAVAYSERCLRDTFFSLWFARASISFQYFRVDIALIISRFAFNLVSFNTLRMRKLEKMNFTWKNEERKKRLDARNAHENNTWNDSQIKHTLYCFQSAPFFFKYIFENWFEGPCFGARELI